MRNLTAFLCLTFAVLLFSTGEGFALPPCPEDQNQRFHNCFGTYTFENGDKYVGEWSDDQRHGQGTLIYADWDKYVGEFRYDKPHGQGTYTSFNGRVTEGVFENGVFLYERKDPKSGEEEQELSVEEEGLGIAYQLYLTVRGCHELGELYVSSAKMESIKSMMKAIDKYITTENNNLDTDTVWETAVNRFDSSDAGKGLKLIKMLDSPYYDEEIGGMCRLQTMQLENIGNSPEIGAKEKKKKDF